MTFLQFRRQKVKRLSSRVHALPGFGCKCRLQPLLVVLTFPIPAPVEFDFKSVLLYPTNAFSRNGKITISKKDGMAYFANRSELSALDIRRVNLLYRTD